MSDEPTVLWIVLKWRGIDDTPSPLSAHLSQKTAHESAAMAVLELEDDQYISIAETVPQIVHPMGATDLGWVSTP